MQKYDSYKDSGIQWLGEIPSHWKLRKMKYTFSERSQKGFPNEPLLAATQNHGVIKKSDYENRTVEAIKNLDTLKLVEEGDFVISLRSFQGGIEYSYCRGIISPAYTVLKAHHLTESYFKHLAKSPIFIDLLKSTVTGIREGQNIDYNKLRVEFLPIPPIEEQQAIASYLDTVTAKIDEAIAQQQKMIDLLNERKQIIINNAVTKGLNPNAPTKPSGIDWIGNIPDHWEVCKLKRVANGFSNGTSATQIAFGTTQYPVTRIETITTGSINYDKVGYVKKDSSLNRYLLKKYDVLISNINSFERVGNCAIYDGQHELYHGMNLLKITPLDDIVPEYLLYSLKSMSYMGQMRRACKPAINQVSVPSSGVKGIMITLPPLSEQEEIANYCSRAMQCIDDSVDICRKQIALLQERKQIIINDVVTGKVKVV